MRRRRTFVPGASLYPQVTSPPVIGPGGTHDDASLASPAPASDPTTPPCVSGRDADGPRLRLARAFVRWVCNTPPVGYRPEDGAPAAGGRRAVLEPHRRGEGSWL